MSAASRNHFHKESITNCATWIAAYFLCSWGIESGLVVSPLPVWRQGAEAKWSSSNRESYYLGNSLKSFALCLERKKYNFPAHCKSFAPIFLSYFSCWAIYCTLYLAVWLWSSFYQSNSTYFAYLKNGTYAFFYFSHNNDNCHCKEGWGWRWSATSTSRGYYIKITQTWRRTNPLSWKQQMLPATVDCHNKVWLRGSYCSYFAIECNGKIILEFKRHTLSTSRYDKL